MLLRTFPPFASHRKYPCRPVPGPVREAGNPRCEIEGDPLVADAQDKPARLLIFGNRPATVLFNRNYFRCFWHVTTMADGLAQPQQVGSLLFELAFGAVNRRNMPS